jgi:hypothetical protein
MLKTYINEKRIITYFRQAYLNKRTFLYIYNRFMFNNLIFFLKFLWMKKVIYGFSSLATSKTILVYLKYNNKNEKKLFTISSKLGWKGIKNTSNRDNSEVKNIYFFIKINKKYFCYLSSSSRNVSGFFIFLI